MTVDERWAVAYSRLSPENRQLVDMLRLASEAAHERESSDRLARLVLLGVVLVLGFATLALLVVVLR